MDVRTAGDWEVGMLVAREERRVSGRPGAEGAPLGRLVVLLDLLVAFVVVVLVVVVGWVDGGAMWRD